MKVLGFALLTSALFVLIRSYFMRNSILRSLLISLMVFSISDSFWGSDSIGEITQSDIRKSRSRIPSFTSIQPSVTADDQIFQNHSTSRNEEEKADDIKRIISKKVNLRKVEKNIKQTVDSSDGKSIAKKRKVEGKETKANRMKKRKIGRKKTECDMRCYCSSCLKNADNPAYRKEYIRRDNLIDE